jgi:hypothetical protein
MKGDQRIYFFYNRGSNLLRTSDVPSNTSQMFLPAPHIALAVHYDNCLSSFSYPITWIIENIVGDENIMNAIIRACF